jgi:hypothetical protein
MFLTLGKWLLALDAPPVSPVLEPKATFQPRGRGALSQATGHSARKNLSCLGPPQGALRRSRVARARQPASERCSEVSADEAGGNGRHVGPNRGAPLLTEHPDPGPIPFEPVGWQASNGVLSQMMTSATRNLSHAELTELVEIRRTVRFPCTRTLSSPETLGTRKSETICR